MTQAATSVHLRSATRSCAQTLAYCDGLRAWFALLVLWDHFAHVGVECGALSGDLYFFKELAHGVAMPGFFLLSSFLLSYRLLSEMLAYTDDTNKFLAIPESVLYFGIRRIFRIYPLFWVFSLTILYVPWFNPRGIQFPHQASSFWLLASAYDENLFWSLVVEVRSYTILPAFCVCAWLLRRAPMAYLCVNVACIAWAHWRWGPLNSACTTLGPWLSTFLLGTLVGIVMAYREQAIPPFDKQLPELASRSFGWLATLLFVGAHAIVSEKYGFVVPGYPFWNWYNLQYSCWPGYALAGVFLICSFTSGGSRPQETSNVLVRIYSNGLLCFAGKVSYSMYLWHLTVLMHTINLVPARIRWRVEHLVLLTFVTVASAAVSFYAIESTSMRAGNALVRLLRRVLRKRP